MARKWIRRFICGLLGLQMMTSANARVPAAESNTGFVTADEIYQMRIYEIFERNKDAFHARFRDHATRIMQRHGFRIVHMWEALAPERTEFVYIIRWPDEAAMKRQWQSLMADPEWARIKQESAQAHGDMVGGIEERVLRLTSYSAPVR